MTTSVETDMLSQRRNQHRCAGRHSIEHTAYCSASVDEGWTDTRVGVLKQADLDQYRDFLTPIRSRANEILDGLVRTHMRLLGASRSSYQVCGVAGLALAVLLTSLMCIAEGLSVWVMAAVSISAIVTFFSLAMVTKVIVGKEMLVYYHHEVAIMAAATMLLWLLGQPILPYLDLTILGLGTFLSFGRIGCLMVGCCHGRPHRWGVRYHRGHKLEGFPRYLVGVRLFPIQAVESCWVACVVLVGCALIANSEPGGALVWYVVAYDTGRFFFELIRGDAGRPYLLDISEAQWISVGLVCLVLVAGTAGYLPFRPWHGWIAVAMVMGASMIVVQWNVRSRRVAKHLVFRADHIRELAKLAEQTDGSDDCTGDLAQSFRPFAGQIGCTSLGIRLSAGATHMSEHSVRHFSISGRDRPISWQVAHSVADLIIQLRNLSGPNQLVAGNHGVFHLISQTRRHPIGLERLASPSLRQEPMTESS
jgi:hypothetical protein